MLVSRLMSGCVELQKCATQDSAHVLEGASGDHVARIQRALVVIDVADIDEAEIRARHFGPTTSREVLKYKTRRNIVNPSYQTRPDAIVGKMTIASLDREMAAREATSPMANLTRTGALY